MIKINLALKKQALSVTQGAGSKKAKLNIKLDSLKELPIRKIIMPLLVGMLANYYLEEFKIGELEKVDTEFPPLQAEEKKLQAELAKSRGYEPIKNQLESDGFALKTKIGTIQKLVAGRRDTYSFLVALAEQTPKEIWITHLGVNGTDVLIDGNSLDFGKISDFMSNLKQNAFFSDVTLKTTQQAKLDGVDIANFQLGAKRTSQAIGGIK